MKSPWHSLAVPIQGIEDACSTENNLLVFSHLCHQSWVLGRPPNATEDTSVINHFSFFFLHLYPPPPPLIEILMPPSFLWFSPVYLRQNPYCGNQSEEVSFSFTKLHWIQDVGCWRRCLWLHREPTSSVRTFLLSLGSPKSFHGSLIFT